jgi:hypothetical protein
MPVNSFKMETFCRRNYLANNNMILKIFIELSKLSLGASKSLYTYTPFPKENG